MVAQTDVLIVGAGPTGLMLALELSAQGIRYRILEATTTPSTQSRALVLHPRTLELLARHGIVEKFIAKGVCNDAIRIYCNREFVYEIDLKNVGLVHPEKKVSAKKDRRGSKTHLIRTN